MAFRLANSASPRFKLKFLAAAAAGARRFDGLLGGVKGATAAACFRHKLLSHLGAQVALVLLLLLFPVCVLLPFPVAANASQLFLQRPDTAVALEPQGFPVVSLPTAATASPRFLGERISGNLGGTSSQSTAASPPGRSLSSVSPSLSWQQVRSRSRSSSWTDAMDSWQIAALALSPDYLADELEASVATAPHPDGAAARTADGPQWSPASPLVHAAFVAAQSPSTASSSSFLADRSAQSTATPPPSEPVQAESSSVASVPASFPSESAKLSHGRPVSRATAKPSGSAAAVTRGVEGGTRVVEEAKQSHQPLREKSRSEDLSAMPFLVGATVQAFEEAQHEGEPGEETETPQDGGKAMSEESEGSNQVYGQSANTPRNYSFAVSFSSKCDGWLAALHQVAENSLRDTQEPALPNEERPWWLEFSSWSLDHTVHLMLLQTLSQSPVSSSFSSPLAASLSQLCNSLVGRPSSSPAFATWSSSLSSAAGWTDVVVADALHSLAPTALQGAPSSSSNELTNTQKSAIVAVSTSPPATSSSSSYVPPSSPSSSVTRLAPLLRAAELCASASSKDDWSGSTFSASTSGHPSFVKNSHSNPRQQASARMLGATSETPAAAAPPPLPWLADPTSASPFSSAPRKLFLHVRLAAGPPGLVFITKLLQMLRAMDPCVSRIEALPTPVETASAAHPSHSSVVDATATERLPEAPSPNLHQRQTAKFSGTSIAPAPVPPPLEPETSLRGAGWVWASEEPPAASSTAGTSHAKSFPPFGQPPPGHHLPPPMGPWGTGGGGIAPMGAPPPWFMGYPPPPQALTAMPWPAVYEQSTPPAVTAHRPQNPTPHVAPSGVTDFSRPHSSSFRLFDSPPSPSSDAGAFPRQTWQRAVDWRDVVDSTDVDSLLSSLAAGKDLTQTRLALLAHSCPGNPVAASLTYLDLTVPPSPAWASNLLETTRWLYGLRAAYSSTPPDTTEPPATCTSCGGVFCLQVPSNFCQPPTDQQEKLRFIQAHENVMTVLASNEIHMSVMTDTCAPDLSADPDLRLSLQATYMPLQWQAYSNSKLIGHIIVSGNEANDVFALRLPNVVAVAQNLQPETPLGPEPSTPVYLKLEQQPVTRKPYLQGSVAAMVHLYVSAFACPLEASGIPIFITVGSWLNAARQQQEINFSNPFVPGNLLQFSFASYPDPCPDASSGHGGAADALFSQFGQLKQYLAAQGQWKQQQQLLRHRSASPASRRLAQWAHGGGGATHLHSAKLKFND
eukprot:GHVT01045260.1.p1 GENE.GHVT01045260.1~~GHVT01045260.1.p1  ORF type:complete len:1248 (-),score=333.39 GHVT01045260.1:602-4345(-)